MAQSSWVDLMDQMLATPYSRANEWASDDYAFKFVQALGVSPHALVSAFDKMAQFENTDQVEFLSTHPSSITRAARIKERL
jgi:predicted Zn-dependent protease